MSAGQTPPGASSPPPPITRYFNKPTASEFDVLSSSPRVPPPPSSAALQHTVRDTHFNGHSFLINTSSGGPTASVPPSAMSSPAGASSVDDATARLQATSISDAASPASAVSEQHNPSVTLSSLQSPSSLPTTVAFAANTTAAGGDSKLTQSSSALQPVSASTTETAVTCQQQQSTVSLESVNTLSQQTSAVAVTYTAGDNKSTAAVTYTAGESQSTIAVDNKLKQYFSAVPSQPLSHNMFDSVSSHASFHTSMDTSMMNPAYMSPTAVTAGYGFTAAIPSPDSFLTPATEQDVLTASLLSSDADRRHDAWIPAASTRKALKAMEANPPGIYFPEKDLLTMPGIAIKEDFGDPIKHLLRSYVGEESASRRQPLTASSVTQDDRGLRQLIAAGCYHAAVNLTTQLLTVYGQGEGRAGHPSKHTAHSIQLWFTRLALLVKLRRYSLAEVECEQFGQLDAPDLYFEFYPELYGGRKGSMVPFSFRLLVAELPHYLGKHSTSLDKLNGLLHTCHQIVSNLRRGVSECGDPVDLSSSMRDDSVKLWRGRAVRVTYSLTATAASLKDYRLCGSLLNTLLKEDAHSGPGLYSALGRLHLHIGDIHAAQTCFNRYLEVSADSGSPVQGLLHSAYIAMAGNDFAEAVTILKQALQLSPANALVINNLGVSLVYTGRIRDAVSVVESALFAQPERLLHESLVLNLATMYELESSNSMANKVKLLQLVAAHKGDSFAVAALKLH